MALKSVSMTGAYSLHATSTSITSREATEYGSDKRLTDRAGRGPYVVDGLSPVIADDVVHLRVYTTDALNLQVKRGEEFAAKGLITVKPVVGRYGLTDEYVVEEHAVGKDGGGKRNA